MHPFFLFPGAPWRATYPSLWGTPPGTFWDLFLTFPYQSEGKNPTKTTKTEPKKTKEKKRAKMKTKKSLINLIL